VRLCRLSFGLCVYQLDYLICEHLEVGQDRLSARDVNAGAVLLGGVDDLAVVDDNGVASSALALEPAEALAELDLAIGSEDL
jgi:hypothetical protein